MLSFDSIPQARLVRKGGHVFAPPPAPPAEPTPLQRNVREMLAVAIGLWPLTAVVLLMVGLIVMAGNNGGP